jgi:hypothetical protein
MHRIAVWIALAATLIASARVSAAPTVAEVGAELGLDRDAIDRVTQGKMVDLPAHDAFERDLSVGFVFLVKGAPRELAQSFRRYRDLGADPNVVASHRIDCAADLDGLRLTPHGADEVHRFTAAQPGDALNLSPSEIASFNALGSSATQSAIEDQLHKMLWSRVQAYRASGLAGIAPYARSDGEQRRPGEELQRVVAQASALLQKHAPPFADALTRYPRAKPSDLEEAFYWVVHNQDNRPTVTLRHRMTLAIGDAVMAADRELYVSQGYNEMQAIGALVPVDGGTIVFYSAHTSTDRVGGAATAMKHSIGRKVMSKQLKEIFERSRNRFNAAKLGNPS